MVSATHTLFTAIAVSREKIGTRAAFFSREIDHPIILISLTSLSLWG